MYEEGFVNFAMRKIKSLIRINREEKKFLEEARRIRESSIRGNRDEKKFLEEVRKIRDELYIMRASLRDADARVDTEHVVREWANQVRKAASDIEDVLDEFEFIQLQETNHHDFQFEEETNHGDKSPCKLEDILLDNRYPLRKPEHHGHRFKNPTGHRFKNPTGHRFKNPTGHRLKNPTSQAGHTSSDSSQAGHTSSDSRMMIEKLVDQIVELRTRVVEISARRQRYAFIMLDQGSTSNHADDRTSDLRSIARFSKEDDLVGIENPKKKLIKWLVEGGSRRATETVAVVGMGGVGKTTLAGNVYYSDRVKAHFKCRAWITVSQSFELKDIFKSMVKELYGSSTSRSVEDMEISKLIETLQKFLHRKRYVIVLDDLWKTDDWHRIKGGLPDGEMGSRIMVTTRDADVATSCTEACRIYNLQPLSVEDSRALFCKNAFRSEYAGQGGICPPHLEDLSKKIVEKCRGLPLAIVTIGGLLSNKKKTPIEWQKLYDRLGYEIESNPNLEAMNKILSLSIDDLSYDLKCCFFYLSMFPEDHRIERMRLIRLWIAEGFVREKGNGTLDLEDVADSYLNELINRSLIQVAKRNHFGKVHACRVHDIVRDIILSKSRKWNFVTPFQKQYPQQSDEIRRLSINCIRETAPDNGNQALTLWGHLRSLIIFPVYSLYGVPFSNLKLLKVLDLEGAFIGHFPDEILCLPLLRFLSLRGTNIEEIPPSIQQLRNLETLDLRRTRVFKLPAKINALKCLRYLLISFRRMGEYKHGVKVEGGVVGSLRSLQKLAYIDAGESRGVMREVGMLTQLRNLGIRNLATKDGIDLCVSLGKIERLHKLSVSADFLGSGLLDISSVSSPPPLEHLRLEGLLLKVLPHWILSLSTLIRLELKNSELKEDPFKALQYLPNLMFLDLKGAYNGTELCCESGGFRSLDSLSLVELRDLKIVTVEEGAMPCLQKLVLYGCYQLRKVPSGIQHLSSLKELFINPASKELYGSISSDGGEEYWKISHIPFRNIRTYSC